MHDLRNLNVVNFSSGKVGFQNPALLVGEDVSSHAFTILGKTINTFLPYTRERQVCATERVAKNLSQQRTRTKKQAAGATIEQEEVKGKIVEHLWWLKKEGYAESTIKQRIYMLNDLLKRGADLSDPESVKETLAKQQNWSDGYKLIAVTAYSLFARMLGIEFRPPRYRTQQKLPFIPLESEIDQLIAGCGKKTSTFLQTLKETGMRPGEAKRLKWTDVDAVTNTITLNQPEKRGNPRMFKASKTLITLLTALPKKSERVFGESSLKSQQGTYRKSRRHLAKKLNNPRLARITFRTLRHWKATMEYHRTKDILYVKNLLGHKKIDNTMKYTQLVSFETEDQFTCKVAKTLDEAKELVETGFEYVTDMDSAKLFRKRK